MNINTSIMNSNNSNMNINNNDGFDKIGKINNEDNDTDNREKDGDRDIFR